MDVPQWRYDRIYVGTGILGSTCTAAKSSCRCVPKFASARCHLPGPVEAINLVWALPGRTTPEPGRHGLQDQGNGQFALPRACLRQGGTRRDSLGTYRPDVSGERDPPSWRTKGPPRTSGAAQTAACRKTDSSLPLAVPSGLVRRRSPEVRPQFVHAEGAEAHVH